MFHPNKYTDWYHRIVDRAKSQNRKKYPKNDPCYLYYESHHVIPKSFGGTNDADNLVLLTAKEHFIVHILLPKMCISMKHTQQMLNALHRMNQKTGKHQRYFNSKLYEYAKRHIVCTEEKKNKHRNRVSCLNTLTGLYEQVSSDEFYRSDHLFGLNHGKVGKKRTDDFKQKRTGELNSFYGKTHTEETKKRSASIISQKLKGKPKSEEHRQKMREAWKRRKGE
jgi:hypothetical protein